MHYQKISPEYMQIFSKYGLISALAALLLGSTLVAVPALAAGKGHRVAHPVVVGTVASVSGTTLMVTAQGRHASTTPATTFTVDAASATIMKNGTASAISAILVGDRVMVRGTVSGTNVIASTINDGRALGRPSFAHRQMHKHGTATTTDWH